AMSAGWLLVIAADVAAVLLVPARWVVPVLGLGNTAGLTAAGMVLLAAVRRARGAAATAGMTRAAIAGVSAAVVGGGVAAALSAAVPASGILPDGLLALAAGSCAVAAFAAVAFALDRGDLHAAAGRVLRRARP
ncbi:MAG: virulence factor MviN, partial [Actinomycetota bacterium]